MDLDEQQITLESAFLSILFFEYSKVINFLQLKPEHLNIKNNQCILAACYKIKDNVLAMDINTLLEFIPKELRTYTMDTVVSDNAVLSNHTAEEFLNYQMLILERYKKRKILALTTRLQNKQMTNDEFFKESEKISMLSIKRESLIINQEEILKHITNKNSGIDLVGFPKMNDTLKIVKGDLIMIGASTGVGKSGFLLNLMNELMNDYQCIYFNLEMSKSTIYSRIVSINSDVPIQYITNPESRSERQKYLIDETLKKIENQKIIIEHKATFLQEIKTVINKYKNPKKHTIIFIDHVGLIKTDRYRSLYEQATEIAKTLRQFCLDYDCTIISACQLNRSSYNSDDLNLSMLKDSGELENSSSKVILLYKNKNQTYSNDKFTDDMVVDIVKNRDGRIGKIKFKYDKTKQIFREDINDFSKE